MNYMTKIYMELTGEKLEENIAIDCNIIEAGNIRPKFKIFNPVFPSQKKRMVEFLLMEKNSKEQKKIMLSIVILDDAGIQSLLEKKNEIKDEQGNRILIDFEKETVESVEKSFAATGFHGLYIQLRYADIEAGFFRTQWALVRMSRNAKVTTGQTENFTLSGREI